MGGFTVSYGVYITWYNMVFCVIVGCCDNRYQEKRFFRLPSFISNQGTQTESLSKKIQDTWLAKIKRVGILPEQYYNTQIIL